MVRKRENVRDAFDNCFSKYKHREDVLEVERDNAAADAEVAFDNVGLDDKLFYAGQVSSEPEWQRWLKEPQAPKSTKLLVFWRAKQYNFPIIAEIA